MPPPAIRETRARYETADFPPAPGESAPAHALFRQNCAESWATVPGPSLIRRHQLCFGRDMRSIDIAQHRSFDPKSGNLAKPSPSPFPHLVF